MGPDPATGVQVISGIPMGMKVDGVSTGSFDSMTNLVNMPVGTLAPGESKVLTVIVRPLSMGPNVIRAVARAHEVDPMPMNNSAMVQTMVQPSPAVAQVSFSGIHHQPTQMTVQFTGEVVGATATDISNYTLVDGGPSGIFGTGADRVVPIYNIAYDPSQFSAILVPSGHLNAHHVYQLTINGAPPNGIMNGMGIPLFGNVENRLGSSDIHQISGWNFSGPDQRVLVGNPNRRAQLGQPYRPHRSAVFTPTPGRPLPPSTLQFLSGRLVTSGQRRG